MREILHQGGPILWLILGCGIAAFVTFIERGLHLHRARIKADDFLKGILNILHTDRAAKEYPPTKSIIYATVFLRFLHTVDNTSRSTRVRRIHRLAGSSSKYARSRPVDSSARLILSPRRPARKTSFFIRTSTA